MTKDKIPCGDSVPIATGVRASKKGIVAVDNDMALKAMDHDFHTANIIPVPPQCAIGKYMLLYAKTDLQNRN